MRILILGTGYVGLVSGACFAEMGHNVICLDIDESKIQKLQSGKIHIYEPNLEEIVNRNVKANRLEFTTDYTYGVQNSLICFLAVPTPSEEDGSADLSFLCKAARQVASNMNGYKIIANKSTVPVGSGFLVKRIIRDVLDERGVSYDFDVVSNPEFLKEGDAVNDFMKPDRIVIGTEGDSKVCEIMEELYAPFNLNSDRLLKMDLLSAEMAKYAANAMLATRISFMNEMAGFCECVGADITMVRKAIGSDKRIGSSFLYAGVGYGGSCFPKDIKALCATAKKYNYDCCLINSVEMVNERQKKVIAEKIFYHFDNQVSGKIFAIWGLSFKPGTDDMREAPSLVVIKMLLQEGAYVRLYDPVAMIKAKELIKKSPQVCWCKDEFEAANGVDAIVLMTEWKQFRFVNFDAVKPKQRLLFDGRNQYDPEEMKRKGYIYYSVGRPSCDKFDFSFL